MKWGGSNHSRGKARILDAIRGLVRKGYILVNNPENEMNNSTYLEVTHTFHTNETSHIECDGTSFKGYEPLYEDIFDLAENNGCKLKVIVYTLWRKNIGYRISYGEWANVLGMSTRTAKRKIKECKEGGLLKVIRGKRHQNDSGEVRQENNAYSLNNTEVEVNEKTDFLTKAKEVELFQDMKDERINKRANLFDWNKRLEVEDMHIYLTTTCSEVKKMAEKRFKAISKSEAGKTMIDAWKKEAMEHIEKKRKRDEETQKQAEEFEPESYFREIQYDRTKQSKRVDISNLLEGA